MSAIPEVNRRILIVDDNRDIHDDFRKLLAEDDSDAAIDAMASELFDLPPGRAEAPAFELSFASQGAEGFEMVARGASVGMPYALVFVDMRMPPGWDGLETLERIWAVDPSIQAVICTAYSDYSWEEIHDRLGSTDRLLVLKKPFDSLEVRQLALALTEKWNDHRERERSEARLRSLLRELDDHRAPSEADDVTADHRATLTDVALPVVPIEEGVIAVPLVGEHDAARMELVAGVLVSAVVARAARVLVLDGSCLTPVGPDVSAGVAMAAQAVEAAGCEVVLTAMPFPIVEEDGGPLCRDTIDAGIACARALASAL